jgi:hypothetical protein
MPVKAKVCDECGVPLALGLATCPNCGARTGTLFSEAGPPPDLKKFSTRPKPTAFDARHSVDKAREGANNSLYLGLASFIPLIGIALGIAAILLGVRADRTLSQCNIEDGRGPAMVGIIVGSLGLVAQISYAVYAWKSGIAA